MLNNEKEIDQMMRKYFNLEEFSRDTISRIMESIKYPLRLIQSLQSLIDDTHPNINSEFREQVKHDLYEKAKSTVEELLTMLTIHHAKTMQLLDDWQLRVPVKLRESIAFLLFPTPLEKIDLKFDPNDDQFVNSNK